MLNRCVKSCILLAGQLRVFTLVDILTIEAVAGVALSAGAEEAAEGVGAVGEDVAGPVLALVVVRHVTAFAAVPVVAVTLTVQTGAVLTLAPCRVTTIIWRKKNVNIL